MRSVRPGRDRRAALGVFGSESRGAGQARCCHRDFTDTPVPGPSNAPSYSPPMFDLQPMRTLFLLPASKVALAKNPKKRPTAEKLLQHPWPLSRMLAIELLEKANNPDHSAYDFDTNPNLILSLILTLTTPLLVPDTNQVIRGSMAQPSGKEKN